MIEWNHKLDFTLTSLQINARFTVNHRGTQSGVFHNDNHVPINAVLFCYNSSSVTVLVSETEFSWENT